MGCFNKIGFHSGLPIKAGDPTVLILYTGEPDPRDSVVYADDNFCPRFFPLFGEYNDYGAIENVEDDVNIKFIKNFFGIEDINQFIDDVDNNMVGRHGHDTAKVPKNDDVFKSLSFGLEHRFVYDFMASKKRSSWNESNVGEYWLEKFGFIFKEKTKKERYNLKWVHPDLKDYVGMCDGNWTQLRSAKTGKEVNDFSKWGEWGIYHPYQLYNVLQKMGLKLEVSDEDKQACIIDIAYDLLQDRIKGNAKSPVGEKELLAEAESLKKIEHFSKSSVEEIVNILKDINNGDRFGNARWPKGITNFAHLYSNKMEYTLVRTNANFIVNLEAKKIVTDFARFNWSLCHLNGKYDTSNYGSQEQDYKEYLDNINCYKQFLESKIEEEK